MACSVPEGYVTNTEDCNDTNDLVSPNATEFCNGVDDNCDGEIDEIGVSSNSTYYLDEDNDGYGQTDNTVTACDTPEGYSEESGDCDDDNNAVYPDAPELCNDKDDDCDDNIDEDSINGSNYYLDSDSDGYGDSDSIQTSCDVPENHVENDLDCDDTTDTLSANTEICDGIDNDCNDVVDEQTGENLTVYYLDDDEDGYGDLKQYTPRMMLNQKVMFSMQMIVMMMTMISLLMLMKYVEMLQTTIVTR